MEQTFTGTITEIRTPRTGVGQKGEWANVEFEVTELNPQNSEYPQLVLFDFFKNGEYLKYAKEFENYYKLGDNVTVHFNFKANEYTNANNELVKFYKTSAWKIEKLEGVTQAFEPAGDLNEPKDNLPF
ncbi:MAG: DUF3127 domain-containing protein [Flavobacteriaceae bacterium]